MLTMATALPDLAVTVGTVAEPDPRQPRRPPARPLWRYRGTLVEPALPPPSDTAAERIRQLAHPAWDHPPAVYDAAVGLAALDLDDLLGLLVHPPAPPATPLGSALAAHDPTLWVRSVQVWACLGLLHHRTDEPWPDSTRRQVLVELAWGVEDWTTEAALFALVTVAWVDPDVRADVAGIAAERLTDAVALARRRPVSILRSLAQLALATPALDPGVAGAARRILRRTTSPDRGGRAGRPRPGGLGRLRGWWSRR
jgi:hypothetical protein